MLSIINMRNSELISANGFDHMCELDEQINIYFSGKIKSMFTEDYICKSLDLKVFYKSFSDKKDYNYLIDKLCGNYIMLIVDNGHFKTLVSDISGIREAYYINYNDRLMISNNFLELVNVSNENVLDYNEILFFLRHGYCHGGRTIFKNINRLPPGKKLSILDGKLYSNKYLDSFRGIRVNYELFEKAFESSFLMNLSINHNYDNVVAFSGGIDSSLVLQILNQMGADPTAITMSVKPHMILYQQDIIRSSILARRFSVDHEIIEIDLNDIDIKDLTRIAVQMPLSAHFGVHFLKTFEQALSGSKKVRVWTGQNSDSLYNLGPSVKLAYLHRYLISPPYIKTLQGVKGHSKWKLIKGPLDKAITTTVRSTVIARYLGTPANGYCIAPKSVNELIDNFIDSESYLALSVGEGVRKEDKSVIRYLPIGDNNLSSNEVIQELFDQKLATFLTGGDPKIFYTLAHILGIEVTLPYSNANMVQLFRNINRGWMDIIFPKRFLYKYAKKNFSIDPSFYYQKYPTDEKSPDNRSWERNVLMDTCFGESLVQKSSIILNRLKGAGLNLPDFNHVVLPLNYAIRLFWIGVILENYENLK